MGVVTFLHTHTHTHAYAHAHAHTHTHTNCNRRMTFTVIQAHCINESIVYVYFPLVVCGNNDCTLHKIIVRSTVAESHN